MYQPVNPTLQTGYRQQSHLTRQQITRNRVLGKGISGLILALLLAMQGCAGTSGSASAPDDLDVSASEQQRIVDLYTNWRVAVANADIPAYLQALHPQVRLLPPGAPAIVGAQNYGKFLVPVFEAANYELEVAKAPVVKVMGDTAIAEYEYVVHLALKNPEVGVSEPGALTANKTRTRYFDVLRKNNEGNWGVWRHTWSVQPE